MNQRSLTNRPLQFKVSSGSIVIHFGHKFAIFWSKSFTQFGKGDLAILLVKTRSVTKILSPCKKVNGKALPFPELCYFLPQFICLLTWFLTFFTCQVTPNSERSLGSICCLGHLLSMLLLQLQLLKAEQETSRYIDRYISAVYLNEKWCNKNTCMEES